MVIMWALPKYKNYQSELPQTSPSGRPLQWQRGFARARQAPLDGLRLAGDSARNHAVEIWMLFFLSMAGIPWFQEKYGGFSFLFNGIIFLDFMGFPLWPLNQSPLKNGPFLQKTCRLS